MWIICQTDGEKMMLVYPDILGGTKSPSAQARVSPVTDPVGGSDENGLP